MDSSIKRRVSSWKNNQRTGTAIPSFTHTAAEHRAFMRIAPPMFTISWYYTEAVNARVCGMPLDQLVTVQILLARHRWYSPCATMELIQISWKLFRARIWFPSTTISQTRFFQFNGKNAHAKGKYDLLRCVDFPATTMTPKMYNGIHL